ncbi:hypothetical protein PUR61_03035, partial [Streptomyces sp. BE20]|nr:hypothetical protein [Streptomyces sp. BE20]
METTRIEGRSGVWVLGDSIPDAVVDPSQVVDIGKLTLRMVHPDSGETSFRPLVVASCHASYSDPVHREHQARFFAGFLAEPAPAAAALLAVADVAAARYYQPQLRASLDP